MADPRHLLLLLGSQQWPALAAGDVPCTACQKLHCSLLVSAAALRVCGGLAGFCCLTSWSVTQRVSYEPEQHFVPILILHTSTPHPASEYKHCNSTGPPPRASWKKACASVSSMRPGAGSGSAADERHRESSSAMLAAQAWGWLLGLKEGGGVRLWEAPVLRTRILEKRRSLKGGWGI